jgi:hypothetical protein
MAFVTAVKDKWRRTRLIWGRAAFVIFPLSLFLHGLYVWGAVDFGIGKRAGILGVLASILNFFLDPRTLWVLELLSAGLVVFIYLQAKNEREKYQQLLQSLPVVSPAAISTPPGNESGLPNWTMQFEWMGSYGIGNLDGVRIYVASTDGSNERVYLCRVTAPDGSSSEYDELRAGSAIFGEDESRLQDVDHTDFLYPERHSFPDAPRSPLPDGSYEVEVFARSKAGPGQVLIKKGRFRLANGSLMGLP